MSISTSKEELAQIVRSDKPHVVILGAGASRAACPKGDKNGKKLPLMNDLVDCLNLKSKFQEWKINTNQNFEDIFSHLYEKEEYEKTKELESLIWNYFNKLRLPDNPTIYDHLVLSLRDTDCIASFNWDPLLLHAYHRNSNHSITLPRLIFLHGNVMVGFCKEHKRVNYRTEKCDLCRKPLDAINLLYPIKKKNYSEKEVIKIQWDRLTNHLDDAFMFTIFGYSGPKTDKEAMNLMKKNWTKKRYLDDTVIITNQNETKTYNHWKSFLSLHHFEIHDDFYESPIANYPRRTFENSYENNVQAKFTETNPIPRDLDFPALWKWYGQFTKAEKSFRKKNPLPPPPKWYLQQILKTN